jgi:glycosyl transferase, family 25
MIDKIYYINLDRRTDRFEQISEELKKMNLEATKFSGISHPNGSLGCTLSHLTILKHARQNNFQNILILEDDFQFLVSKEEFETQINNFFNLNIPWDILMLSYNIQKSKPYNSIIQKVYEGQTTSGYIVNSCFYDRLITVIEKNIFLLQQTGQHWKYTIDQCWKVLQGDNSNWYAFNTRIGLQRESYSDITKSISNNKC